MWKLFIADIKMRFRNKQAIFWTLVFPLIFAFIFGAFFGNDNMNVGTMVLVNKSDSKLSNSLVEAITKSEVFKIKTENDVETGKDLMKKSQAVLVLEIPENFGNSSENAPSKVNIITDPANAQANSAAKGILDTVFTQASFSAQNAKPLFGINEEQTSSNNFSYFAFVLVGLIGMALMNSSIQGVAISLTKYREDQILKRIKSTPLHSSAFVLSEILSQLVVAFIQVCLILMVGKFVFDTTFVGNIFLIFSLSLLGAILFQSIGFAIASLCKTTDAAEGMSQAVTIPMMFLGGVFFPIDSLPNWLLNIVNFLPLAPLLRMMRSVAIDNASPLINPLNMWIVVIWIVVLLFITIKKFKFFED